MTRREIILSTISDLVEKLLWSDRKDDEELPRGSIETAISLGEITKRDIIHRFENQLDDALKER